MTTASGTGDPSAEFDPDAFSPEDGAQALREGVRLFNGGEYHEAHDQIERCWLAGVAADSDFYKGLIQACICLHHLELGNLEGARRLHTGHRRLLAPYLPAHRGVDLAHLLGELERVVRPALSGESAGNGLDPATRPRMRLAGG